ncbi:conserved hypothetical protein [Ricinus communis]|uniref:Uncharacterized protein n=1 Tax=Ricinus communis TaxID=3988 RepID=B9SI78_RICCO|nr:conserved hypothetical protein [Ricinus communis]
MVGKKGKEMQRSVYGEGARSMCKWRVIEDEEEGFVFKGRHKICAARGVWDSKNQRPRRASVSYVM